MAATPPPGSSVTSWRTVRVEKKSIFPPAPAFTITAARSPPSACKDESTPARANADWTVGSDEKTFRCPAAAALASARRRGIDRPSIARKRSTTARAASPSTTLRVTGSENRAKAWFVRNGTTSSAVTRTPRIGATTGPVTRRSSRSANGSAVITPSSGACPVASHAARAARADDGKSGVMLTLIQ
jgi:hypothetical protein